MSESPASTVWFVPGGATALVGEHLVALVAVPPAHSFVQALAKLIEGHDETIDDLAALITSTPLHEVPAFAALVHTDGSGSVMVRGDVEITVTEEQRTSPTQVSAAGLTTWAEVIVAQCREVRMAVTDAGEVDFDSTLYNASFGVLPATGVQISWERSDDEKSTAGPTPTPGQRASVGSEDVKDMSQESGDPSVPRETAPDPSSVLDGEGHTLAAMEESPEEPSTDVHGDDNESAVSATGSPFASPFEQVVPPGPSTSSLTGTYDDLFGSTQIRTVEGAAVRPEEDLHEDGQRVVLEPSEPVNDAAHDGRTITMKDLLAISRGAQDPISSRREAPSILSVLCPDQHPNTPHDATCRVCGLLIAPQEPIPIPRPPLGRLAFSSGELVVIDRTALIGRSPKASGMLADGLPPEIIKVESPEKDISRTHLELRVEGWQVLAIDLDSANGTFVTVPGRAQQRLRPDVPFIIQPGSRVRLADELEFRFEVMP